jgi:hypothetical protein
MVITRKYNGDYLDPSLMSRITDLKKVNDKYHLVLSGTDTDISQLVNFNSPS